MTWFTLEHMNTRRPTVLNTVFFDHPHTVDETYREHAAFAGRFSARLFVAAGAAAIHAIVPCLFEKTASRMVAELHEQTAQRGRPAATLLDAA